MFKRQYGAVGSHIPAISESYTQQYLTHILISDTPQPYPNHISVISQQNLTHIFPYLSHIPDIFQPRNVAKS